LRLGDLTERAAVESALSEFRRLGRDAFLNKNGFGPSRVYFLDEDGDRFDSKPIVAAAWGYQHGTPLRPNDFSGGEKTVAAALRRLGYTVHIAGAPYVGLTVDAVNEVLDEIDNVGEAAFLTTWGQNAATRYVIQRDGRTYPAKAVIAVAAGRVLGTDEVAAPGDWPGDARTVAKPLKSLGFNVIDLRSGIKKSSAAPSVFGEIPGYPPGAPFDDRAAVRLAGLHRHEMAGISGNPEDGADAIVVSGGYKDDLDFGDRLLYTGQGGRDDTGHQVEDQTLTAGNFGLANSETHGLPVRVIRGAGGDPAHSPKSGYRYAGLFTVARHWQEPSTDGPLIYRFELSRAPEADGAKWVNPGANTAPPPPLPTGNTAPGKLTSTVQRIVRNTAVAEWVKKVYDYTCQFCGTRLSTPGGPYAEGAHIRPLGGKHQGMDVPANILCLCANCHVRFDKGALYIENGQLIDTDSGSVMTVFVDSGHPLDTDSIDYHRRHFGLPPTNS
jgi:putative restriction endonuclease